MWKTIRSAPRPTASAAAASSAFTFSGPSAIGATTGTSPAASASRTACGRDGSGDTDVAELRNRRRAQADLVPGEADGPGADRGAQLSVDLEQRLAHDRDRGGVGHAPAADERASARRGHRGRDLLPAAVDDDGVLELAELRDARRPTPPTFTHDHVVYSALIRT